jgi:hypothetical protein
MIVEHRYSGRSTILHGLRESRIGLAADTLRETTFFRGTVGQPLLLREALAALHAVVTSDFKYRPRERPEFRAWLEEQDRKILASLALRSHEARASMERLEARLGELDAARRERLRPFHRARQAFFEHVWENQYELHYLLDPVITVHPDEVSFEAFSRDESIYARLAAKHELFDRIEEFECGTTNIDFSTGLHGELERMRTYRRTGFEIGPEGFAVTGGGSKVTEKKIDLPESWVQGFLQVHSTMSLGLTRVRVAAVDLFNVCRALRRRRARVSPRALRYEMEPGRPARVVLEPWQEILDLGPESVYEGAAPQTIRTWGRDRLKVIERLLPVCRKADVYLAGLGLPSFYVLDLGSVTFTLGLSGWTDNDWTGGAARFHLLTRRAPVSAAELFHTYTALRQVRQAAAPELAQRTGLTLETVRSAVSHLCQVGRAMLDLGSGVYRHRDLFFEPFSPTDAQAAVQPAASETKPHEQSGRVIAEAGDVRIIARRPVKTGYKLSGSAKGADGKRVRPLVHVDAQGAILEASCTCREFRQHRLTQGPCEHILALRLAHLSRLDSARSGGNAH